MAFTLTADALASVGPIPSERAAEWVQPLNAAMAAFGIDTAERGAAFLAQVMHESGDLARLEEDLIYSAERLVAVWPHRFFLPPDDAVGRADASDYEKKPDVLANLVYASRMGNGPPESGDGWAFRGRGLIQLTGRTSYTKASAALGIDLITTPGLLLQPEWAAKSAAWFWSMIRGNDFADQNTATAFGELTVAINGQTEGLEDRTALWSRAKEAFQCA
jgi:putative chitinase